MKTSLGRTTGKDYSWDLCYDEENRIQIIIAHGLEFISSSDDANGGRGGGGALTTNSRKHGIRLELMCPGDLREGKSS